MIRSRAIASRAPAAPLRGHGRAPCTSTTTPPERQATSPPRTPRRSAAPADIDALNHKLAHLEQQAIDLRLQLDDRDQDLAAARAANRELISQLNATARRS